MKNLDTTLEKLKRVQDLLKNKGLVSREESIRLKMIQPEEQDSFTSRVVRTQIEASEEKQEKSQAGPAAEPALEKRAPEKPKTAEELLLERAIKDISRDHYIELDIRIADDGLHAWLSASVIRPRTNGEPPLGLAKLKEILRMHGIKAGLDERKLIVLLGEMERAQSFQMELIAEGRPAVPGKSAIVNLYFEQNESVLVQNAEEDEDEDLIEAESAASSQDKVDFRELMKISMAKAGQLLAESYPPEEGKDGFTVKGAPLLQPQIERRRVFAGKNCHVNENHGIVADVDGRIRYDGKIISVNPVYRLVGNVGFRHGNIHFNGDVKIVGEVQSGFKVEGGGEVTITRSVENAQIVSGGDLEIGGAFIGGESGMIVAGKNCKISHTNGGMIEVHGNLKVRRELLNSRVSVWNQLEASKNSSIIGGQVFIKGHADVWNVGSQAGSLTIVHMGAQSFIFPRIKQLQKLIRGIDESLMAIRSSILGLHESPLSTTEKDILAEDLERGLKDLEQEKQGLEQEMLELKRQVYQCPASFLRVRGVIWPGVKLVFGSSSMDVKEAFRMVEYYLDPKDGKTIRWRPLRR